MTQGIHSPRLVRFGAFEADVQTGELRKDGVKLKFSGQPFQVLAILLERPGDVVTREELQKRLWPDTFVDVERNLNTAVNKIREVLGDSAESPRYLETLPRRGYRFIAPVETDLSPVNQDPVEKPIESPAKPRRLFRLWLRVLSAAVALVVGIVLWISFFKTAGTPRVVRFTQLTHDGQRKDGPILSDGVRIYFNESLPDGKTVIAQVAVNGGEVVPLSVPLKVPSVRDLSRDGTELLIANLEGIGDGTDENSIWLQPVAGGSPLRIGSIVAGDAAFGADGTVILYGKDHAVFSANRDGSGSRKLFTVGSVPFDFHLSPDERVFRFTQFDFQTDMMKIMEAAADGTGLRKIEDGCCGEWTRDGRFFIFQNRQQDRLDFWARSEQKGLRFRKQDDRPIQLTSGPLDFQDPLPSKDGKEVFATGTLRRAEVIRYDSHSHEFVPYLGGISAEGLAFSPDRQWVAYTSYPDGTLWRSPRRHLLQTGLSAFREQIFLETSIGDLPLVKHMNRRF